MLYHHYYNCQCNCFFIYIYSDYYKYWKPLSILVLIISFNSLWGWSLSMNRSITLPLRCQGVNVIFLCITTEAWPSILQTHLPFSQTRPLAVSTTTSLYPRTSAPTVTATNIFPYLWPVEYLLIIPDSDRSSPSFPITHITFKIRLVTSVLEQWALVYKWLCWLAYTQIT